MITLPAGIQAAILTDHIFAHLIKLDLTPTPIFLTEANHSISFGGDTYLGNGILSVIEAVNLRSEVSTGELRIEFSGADQTIIQSVLANQQINRIVTINKAFLNGSTIIDTPIEIWSGLITGHSIADERGGEATIQLTVASEWADFEKTIGRRTTLASQQKFFPNDKGFEFAGETAKEIKWGVK